MTANPKPSARLAVKVVPGSSRDWIVGWLGDALTIKVAALTSNSSSSFTSTKFGDRPTSKVWSRAFAARA